MMLDVLILIRFLIVVDGSVHEQQLLEDLFLNYNSAVRPVIDDVDAVNVTFGLSLRQIIAVQEKTEILVVSAWIRQKWYNPFLTWNSTKYNNIKEINVDPSKIWIPDIVLYNNAEEDKMFAGNLDVLKTRAKLRYDGQCIWLAPVILRSKCEIDVTYFPFDTQKCPLKFGSWTYDKERLNLLKESDTAALENYYKSSEWLLESALAELNEQKYFCCPELYPDVTFTIKIARRSLFYICNLIFPLTVIGMLTMFAFILPAESGERVSLAVNLLLALIVFMLFVTNIIPPTSDVIPLVGILYSAFMAEMVLMIVVLCYIMRIYHRDPHDRPMSVWTKRWILDWLSYIVRIRDPKDTSNYSNKHEQSLLRHLETSSFVKLLIKESEKRSCYKKAPGVESPLSNSSRQNGDEQLLDKIDTLLKKLQIQDEEHEIKANWRIVAMTLDRCLFILFATMITLTLFACFSMSPQYVS